MTIDLSDQLKATEKRDPAPMGTKRIHYSPAKDGPFLCSRCIWFSGQKPEQGEDPAHLIAIPHGRCDHPEALLDDELPWADAEHTAKVVEAGGCCEEERKRSLIELTEALSEAPEMERWHGIAIAIENRAGTTRSGDGWAVKLKNDYGYIRRVMGMDQAELDCFIGDPASSKVWIIRISDPQGADDEDKVVLGADSISDALNIIHANYSSGWNAAPLRWTEMNLEDFKRWLGIQGADDLLSDVKGKPIAFDFDGTLAKRRGGHDDQKAGKPIHKVFEAVAEWRKRGYDPYVLTARTDLEFVGKWLRDEGLSIDVTNEKRPGTLAVVDDRAVDVEKHDFDSIMKQIEGKVKLSEISLRESIKPLRDTATPFWDAPVHKAEAHVDFRSIHSSILKHEDVIARALSGGLRVSSTRELARQAIGQLASGKRAHQLSFHAPAEIATKIKPKLSAAYHDAKREAQKEAKRLTGRAQVALDAVSDKREEKALLALLALLEDRYTNFLAGAMREAAASQAAEIHLLINTGKVADAERELEAFANKYSDGKLDSIASQTVRETTRDGRAAGFLDDPQLGNVRWFRSALLDGNTCPECARLDGSTIDGPEADLSEACEGKDNCRCLPVAVLKDQIA